MSFGFNQLNNPTPATATWVFRIVLYLAQLGNIAIVAFTKLPDDTKLTIVSISSFATLAVHSASKMFGVPLPEGAEVKASDVADLKVDKPETN